MHDLDDARRLAGGEARPAWDMLRAIMRATRSRPSSRKAGVGVVARALVVVAVSAVGASCFDGADALGLPCLGDAECGQGQRCEQGFCGGPPATSTETTAPVDSSSSGSSTAASTGSSADESTGPLPGCGNGVLESGEECDPGPAGDAAECDYDCTVVMCGDGYANLEAGEECDDANDAMVDDCTPQCRATLFWDDMQRNPLSNGEWEVPVIPMYDFMGAPFFLEDGWRWEARPGSWSSGPYSLSSGTAQIITRPIEFPPDPGMGFHYELQLRHHLRFDGNLMDGGCDDEHTTSDGGVVWIMEEGGLLRPAGPPLGHPDTLDNPGDCSGSMVMPEPDNPLYDPRMPRPVYSGNSGVAFTDDTLVLPDVAGTTVRLVFEVSYDCYNCWGPVAPMGAGWLIDEVVVAAVPR